MRKPYNRTRRPPVGYRDKFEIRGSCTASKWGPNAQVPKDAVSLHASRTTMTLMTKLSSDRQSARDLQQEAPGRRSEVKHLVAFEPARQRNLPNCVLGAIWHNRFLLQHLESCVLEQPTIVRVP